MKSNHFFIPYAGNKRRESDDIYKIVEPNLKNIKIIIEPFCGTSAFSYFMSCKYPKRFKYILNDFNVNLIKLYQILKNEEETNKMILNLKILHQDMTKEKYTNMFKNMNDCIENMFIVIQFII